MATSVDSLAIIQKKLASVEQSLIHHVLDVRKLNEKQLALDISRSALASKRDLIQAGQKPSGESQLHSDVRSIKVLTPQEAVILIKSGYYTTLTAVGELLDKVPDLALLEQLGQQNIDEGSARSLLEKFCYLLSVRTDITYQRYSGTPGILECLKTAASFFYPDRAPGNMWEAQQMLQMLGMGIGGLMIGTSIAGPIAPIAAMAAGVGIVAHDHFYGDLPKDMSPCKNLTLHAKAGAFPPLIGRDETLSRIFHLWNSTSQGVRMHPLLVGSSGAGKTMIMQEVARRLALNENCSIAPEALKVGYVFQCTAAELLPASQFEGADKMEWFMRRVGKYRERVAILIDEVHTFLNETYKDRFGELLKSILDTSTTGLPFVLAATTIEEYNKYVKDNGPISRRFQVVPIDPIGRDATIAVLHQQMQLEHKGFLYDPVIMDYIYEKTNMLEAEGIATKQPEISKQVLAMSISKVLSANSITEASKSLAKKNIERARLVSSLDYSSTKVTDHDRGLMDQLRDVDRKIEELKKRETVEKDFARTYSLIIKKISNYFGYLAQLSQQGDNPDSFKQFKFISFFLIPSLLRDKRDLEALLTLKSLDKEIVDSIIENIKESHQRINQEI